MPRGPVPCTTLTKRSWPIATMLTSVEAWLEGAGRSLMATGMLTRRFVSTCFICAGKASCASSLAPSSSPPVNSYLPKDGECGLQPAFAAVIGPA